MNKRLFLGIGKKIISLRDGEKSEQHDAHVKAYYKFIEENHDKKCGDGKIEPN